MTTRGQGQSNEATTSNTPVSGTILNMLTSSHPALNEMRNDEGAQKDPAVAKDVGGVRSEGPAISKDHVIQINRKTDPAEAKDPGELLRTQNPSN